MKRRHALVLAMLHACYKTSNGALRVIDTGAGGSCSASESPLQWSQTGPPGPAGPAGAPGANGATNVVIRTFTQTLVPNETATFTAACHAGEVATGGGYKVVGGSSVPPLPVTISESEPSPGPAEPSDGATPNGWRVVAENTDAVDHDVAAYAVCASP